MVPSRKPRPGEEPHGVLGDEEVLVRGLQQVVEGLRRGEVLVGEVLLVVVDADVAGVDGRDPLLPVRLRVRRDRVQALGLVRGEQAVVESAGEQGVVDAEEDVAARGALGQDLLVERGPGVAALEDLDLVAGLLRERLQHLVRDVEGVVADQGDGLGAGSLGRPGARGAVVSAAREDGDAESGGECGRRVLRGGVHVIPPGGDQEETRPRPLSGEPEAGRAQQLE